jgi:hypothetical protein
MYGDARGKCPILYKVRWILAEKLPVFLKDGY